jgi:hypothetical protein
MSGGSAVYPNNVIEARLAQGAKDLAAQRHTPDARVADRLISWCTAKTRRALAEELGAWANSDEPLRKAATRMSSHYGLPWGAMYQGMLFAADRALAGHRAEITTANLDGALQGALGTAGVASNGGIH